MRAGLFIVLSILFVYSNQQGVGYSVSEVTSYNVMGTHGNSTLYNVTISNDPYDVPIFLIDLWGSRHQIGVDYGVLLGHQIVECYDVVFKKLFSIPNAPPIVNQALQIAIGLLMDQQWEAWLSKEVPSTFLSELDGIESGGMMVGIIGLKRFITRTIVLANIPSDVSDLKYVFLAEYQESHNTTQIPSNEELIEIMNKILSKAPKGLQCSMFGVWGSRTQNADLFSARNLDWTSDIGLTNYKTIQIWHPNDGAYEHSAIGYSIMYGSLAGISAKGLTVHEANLETDVETFSGFPWILRLRYVMENAADLTEAWNIWAMTNNTVGYNHMITSASDAHTTGVSHPAVVVETMAGYSAYFLDDDPRESGAKVLDYETGEYVRYGFPLSEALWRTNHGYDPIIREHYMWRNFTAGKWSEERYMFAFQQFMHYERENILIGPSEAINTTAILGDKGHHAYQCQNNTDGTNILSVTFQPGAQQIWASWETGTGSSWRPACCSNYVHFDLSRFFSQRPQRKINSI